MEWIKTTDRLPDYNKDVLLRFKRQFSVWHYSTKIGHRSYTNKNGEHYMIYDHKGYSNAPVVTHWMPLPSPPKE